MSRTKSFFGLVTRTIGDHTILLCGLLTVLFAAYPVELGLFRQRLNYNEGWNVYNALAVAQHHWIYPPTQGWTANNYPMVSFLLMAGLHSVTHDFLFTGRAVAWLSTLLLSVLVGAIVRELGGTRRSAVLAALFNLAFFSADTASIYASALYIDADDPQMLALAMFVFAVWLYLRARRTQSSTLLSASALVFVLAGSIKHNPIDILFAVLLDVFLLSRRRFVLFATVLVAGAALSIVMHLRLGGPWFFRDLLSGRVYVPGKAIDLFGALFAPVPVIVLAAAAVCFTRCRTADRRIVLFLFCFAAAFGLYFGTAQGVSINCLFELMIAMSLATGLLFADLKHARVPNAVRAMTPLLCFLMLLAPASIDDHLHLHRLWRQSVDNQKLFDGEVAFLRSQPGPALCESLLRCALADKPYLYDPFNATRLIRLGVLPASEQIDAIRAHRYGAIELHDPAPIEWQYNSEHFDHSLLTAIQQNYRIALQDGRETIYVPDTGSGMVGPPGLEPGTKGL